MLNGDIQVLGARLAELAEVFDRKPISEKGLTVWFGVLRDFPTERVCGVLIGWPKSHTKFPAPAEVWKIVNDSSIGERERKAAEENKRQPFHPGVGGAQAEQFIAKMREVLKGPRWTPREHWERLLERSAPNTIGHRYATEALMKYGARSAQPEREPGQDDDDRKAGA